LTLFTPVTVIYSNTKRE